MNFSFFSQILILLEENLSAEMSAEACEKACSIYNRLQGEKCHLTKERKYEGKNETIDQSSDKKRRTETLTASYERARMFVYVRVCVRVHVPVEAGWATPPCLMSL